jgi:hypothetical protein
MELMVVQLDEHEHRGGADAGGDGEWRDWDADDAQGAQEHDQAEGDDAEAEGLEADRAEQVWRPWIEDGADGFMNGADEADEKCPARSERLVQRLLFGQTITR